MKVLEAFSVMRLNDSNFTSTLKRKLSATQSDASTVSNGSLDRKQRSDSVSSSTSSDSPAVSSLEHLPSTAGSQFSPDMLGGGLGELPEERRYSASFHDVHSVEPIKEPWNAACPPYSSQESQGDPPPYTEKPREGSLRLTIDDGVVTTGASSHQSRHKQLSMLHKLRLPKMRSVFSSSGPSSHGPDKRSKSGSKPVKSPGEKRRLFSGIKRLSTQSGVHEGGQGKPAGASKNSDSSETRI